jgi:TonB-dependent receptor
MNKKLLSLAFFVYPFCAAAQTGAIHGIVKDSRSKDALIGATILIEGTQLGVVSDAEGNFAIANVPVGTHKIVLSYVSYKSKQIPNVRVEADSTTLINTELDEEGTVLLEVVVKGDRATNTEVAVINEVKQLKPIAVGISSQQIQKSQDRDAAAAIRRIPGVSVVDNRFVMIRGLGSRYNSVLINDIITPSTEVDTRSFSFDLVSSNMLDRMIVYKSGSAELPGDFAGGVIKIYTKRRPDQQFTDVGLTLGYRAKTTLNHALTHTRSGANWLGLWGKDQQLPSSFPSSSGTFNRLNTAQRAAYARLLPNSWGVKQITAAPDVRLAVAMGNRFDIGEMRASNLTSVNYSNTNQQVDIDFNIYQNGLIANDVYETYKDANYSNQTRVGLVHNWSLWVSPLFTIEWKTLFNQLSSTETVVRQGNRVVDGFDALAYSERFENRSILTTQLAGEYTRSDRTKMNWIAAYGYTGRWEPDWKRVRYQRMSATPGEDNVGTYRVAMPVDPNPVDVGRFYSKLGEQTFTFSSNGEHSFGTPSAREQDKFRFGVYGENKSRDYSARFYGYHAVADASAILSKDINSVFDPINFTGQAGGLSMKDGTKDIDSYHGSNTYVAAYVTGDFHVDSRSSMSAGFRAEINTQGLTTRVVNQNQTLVNNTIFSPLPLFNFTYHLTEQQNIRFSYSATVNRPEFRELAPYSYFDFNLLADIRGNATLKTATIQNVDAKWELFPSKNELISVTAFYKHFRNPIETFLIPTGSGLSYTFINARSAKNYGMEVEIRKGFTETASPVLQDITLVANASWISSTIDLGARVIAPDMSGATHSYDLTGLTHRKRALANQSPYLLNGGIYYANDRTNWQANLLYNIFGQRIFAVGNRENPTIYEMPRHVIDLNISKKFTRNLELRFGIQDVLNQPARFAQDFNGDGKIGKDVTSEISRADQNVRTFKKGSYFTIAAAYTFTK